MAAESGQRRELRNETAVNVVGLLKDSVGAFRLYRLLLDEMAVEDDVAAREIAGEVRLTRLRDGVMATVTATGIAPLTCVRCLREYDQLFAVVFDEEYWQTVDLRTGVGLESDRADDEQSSRIDENHELDLREPLRQEILVSLPMRPDCGEACPGPDALAAGDGEDADVIDDRLAALASLLGDEPESAGR